MAVVNIPRELLSAEELEHWREQCAYQLTVDLGEGDLGGPTLTTLELERCVAAITEGSGVIPMPLFMPEEEGLHSFGERLLEAGLEEEALGIVRELEERATPMVLVRH